MVSWTWSEKSEGFKCPPGKNFYSEVPTHILNAVISVMNKRWRGGKVKKLKNGPICSHWLKKVIRIFEGWNENFQVIILGLRSHEGNISVEMLSNEFFLKHALRSSAPLRSPRQLDYNEYIDHKLSVGGWDGERVLAIRVRVPRIRKWSREHLILKLWLPQG